VDRGDQRVQPAAVRVGVDQQRLGEQAQGDAAGMVFELLSGDGSFEHAQDFWGGSSGGAVPGDVGLGRTQYGTLGDLLDTLGLTRTG
jgi:hypothetical protein